MKKLTAYRKAEAELVLLREQSNALNEEINKRERLKEEGIGFNRKKGVGQGDVSLPLLWVAVFDMLLTALREIDNGFKTHNID